MLTRDIEDRPNLKTFLGSKKKKLLFYSKFCLFIFCKTSGRQRTEGPAQQPLSDVDCQAVGHVVPVILTCHSCGSLGWVYF